MLKCFSHYPERFLDIIRKTDPSTVTQHGLYVRELTHDHHSSPVHSQAYSSSPLHNGQKAKSSGQAQSVDGNHPETQPPQPSSASQSLQLPQEPGGKSTLQAESEKVTSLTRGDAAHTEGDANQCEGSSSQPQGAGKSQSRGVWGRGRVTLLGDSAHATVPNGQLKACIPPGDMAACT